MFSKVAIEETVSKSTPSGKTEVLTATHHDQPTLGSHDGYDGHGLGALGAMETDFLSLRTDMAKIKLQMSELLTVPWMTKYGSETPVEVQ